jgi:hypothetical protein
MKCPNCKAEILNDNINIQADIAKCSNCGNIFKISENISDVNNKFDIKEVPKGAWFIQDFETTTIGASTRSWIAFFLVPFMIVWSGASLGGIYGSQILTGKFSLFNSLFGIPFILGSIIFWSLALMAIWGKVELIFNKQGGKVFTGVGKIGITKKFTWEDVSRINETAVTFRYPGSRGSLILFEGKKRLSFGSGLNEERRYYILQSLRKFYSQIKR